MMEYRSAIVDECGDIVYWCDESTREEIDECLAQHPEWRERCIFIGGREYERMF
mgnify:CR=1 FL=1